MIYLDTSVVLAEVFAEDRKPARTLWREPLIASRLLHYEVWVRLHARRLDQSHGESVRDLLSRVSVVELAPPVLERALEPFPVPIRTLDALHLASILYLRAQRLPLEVATFDERMLSALRALAIPVAAM